VRVHEGLVQISLETGNDGVDRIEIALDDVVRTRYEDEFAIELEW
jgi:hypothetical protein